MTGSTTLKEPRAVDARWALLERVAGSRQLRRVTRLQSLLFYLGRSSLKDGCEQLHEQRVGVEVFNRPEGYDTSIDNIVRTSVSELRKRIEAYFASEGAAETLLMEIPRWSYIPVFRDRQIKPEQATAEPQMSFPAQTLIQEAAHRPPGILVSRRSLVAAASATGALVMLLLAGCFLFWSWYRSLSHAIYPWHSEPAVADLWTRILNARPDTDIVLADASFGLLQDLDKQRFPFDDYLNRSYIAPLQAQNLSPQIRNAIDRVSIWNLGSQDEFKLAHRLLALDPLGANMHLYSAREFMPDLTTRDNVILIGGNLSNPWDDLCEDRMNFVTTFASDGSIAVANRAPHGNEQRIYEQTPSVEYCVVAYLPNPDHNGVVLLIEGTNAEATEAAGDFLLSQYKLSDFARMLHVSHLPYFEVLLKVSSVPGTPLSSTLEAYRDYPQLH